MPKAATPWQRSNAPGHVERLKESEPRKGLILMAVSKTTSKLMNEHTVKGEGGGGGGKAGEADDDTFCS